MPSQKNLDRVENIKQKVKNAKSIIVADYAGLDVASQVDLRAKVAEVGGEFRVTKNRLFKLAISDQIKDSDQLDAALNGPNAFLFSYDDAVSALKALVGFAEDNEALEIKLGLIDDKVLSLEEVKDLSKLPSKTELIGQLISRINGPSYGLVNVLSATTRGLVQVLKAHHDNLQAAN